MTISRKQKNLLYVAKTKTGLDEETYRSALVQIGGVASIKELDKDGFEALMGYFEYLGFAPLSAKGANYGARLGMASFAQIEFIRTLWLEYTHRRAGEDELNKWLERTWKISSLRFLRVQGAPKVIMAMKAMKARAVHA